MKNINIMKRLKNKTFLVTFGTALVAFIYQLMGIVGIVPSISEDTITQMVAMCANLLVMLGIIVDPTTPGVTDGKDFKNE